MPNGVELKAERRKPSGEKHRDIENIPSLTGVLAHFRFHEFNAILLHASGPKLAATGAVLRVCFFPTQSTNSIAAVQQPTSTSTVSLSTASLSTSTTKYAAMNDLSCSLATSTWKNLHQRKHRPARIVRKGSGLPFVRYEQKGGVCR